MRQAARPRIGFRRNLLNPPKNQNNREAWGKEWGIDGQKRPDSNANAQASGRKGVRIAMIAKILPTIPDMLQSRGNGLKAMYYRHL